MNARDAVPALVGLQSGLSERKRPGDELLVAALDLAIASLRAGGEPVAWELRVQYEPKGIPGPWSKWQRCDRDDYDAIMRGEGYFEYRNAEASRPLRRPHAAAGGGAGVGGEVAG